MNNENKISNSIDIKPVKDLLEKSFFIPKYQRGYRWGKQQVKDLLDDLNEFFSNNLDNKHENVFYCLQPLVVREMTEREKKEHGLESTEKWYEVIDGQQRLTTIFLILKCLDGNDPYELSYETRPGSKKFLSEINNKNSKDEAENNIDFFYILQAYKKIKNWCSKQAKQNDEFKNKLLKDVRFIWYKIDESDTQKVFSRLNSGKISLTNGELIKALFLRNNESNDDIAKEWNKRILAISSK